MRTLTKLILPLAILTLGLLFDVSKTSAKPDYTRRTKKDCEFCHPPNSRELNDAGIYYRDHQYKLDGYKPKDQPAKGAAPAQNSQNTKK